MDTRTMETKTMINKNIHITLCIGLYGVCVISIVNDKYDIVSNDIESLGTEGWYENLPKHNKPMQGIYSLICQPSVAFYGSLTYKILTAEAA
jgi:hypothetical protein